jgi:FtsP/CotA-like multicopper oxidase with cupredoxin domain
MSPGYNPAISILGGNIILSKNVFRIRFLNAYLKAFFSNLVFGIVDSKDPTKFKGVVPFTLIGTDSTLMRDPSCNMTSFSLGSGERVDILINFNIK